MITPVLKYYLIEQNRIAFERQRKKIEKDSVITSPVMANSFYQLRNWSDYVNQMRPVVHLLIVPEVSATGKSTFLSLLALGVGLMGGSAMVLPPDFKFKADFEEMSLTCDGKLVKPIQRGKIEFIKSLTSYHKMKQRTAYAGIYTYSAETFAPDKCKQMSLQVVSQQNPTTPEIRVVDPRMVQQVWSDFEPYRLAGWQAVRRNYLPGRQGAEGESLLPFSFLFLRVARGASWSKRSGQATWG